MTMEVVRELNDEAKRYYKEIGDHKGALERYFKALDICKKTNLTEEAASIHGNCAHLLLQAGSFYQAYKHANACIELYPSYDKAYIRRAESLKKALLSGKYEVPANLTFENVITDYCKGHGIKSNVKAFVEAILLAVDQGRSGMVIHIRRMELDFCNKVLLEILSRPECKEAHLEFLMSKMWNEKEINVSKVTLKQLVIDREVTSSSVLQRFLELGLPLSKDDIKMAIKKLRPSQVHLFKFIIAKSNPADLGDLCQTAISANRMMLVLNLVEKGAKLPSHGSELLLHALKTEDYDGAMALAKRFTKSTMDKLDLASLMDTNIINCPELIKTLVEMGISPNGRGRKTPIATVMGKTALSLKKRIEVMCHLLDVGEDCSHLSHLGKSSATPLHVATDLALQSGGDLRLIGSVVCSPTFNSSKVANDKGESPLHLAVKSHWKRELSTTVLTALLETELLDPMKRDQSGKRPIDYLSKSDSRMAMLDEAARKLKPESSSQLKKKQKKKKSKSNTLSTNSVGAANVQKEAETKVSQQQPTEGYSGRSRERDEPKPERPYEELTIPNKVERLIKQLMLKGSNYFQVEVIVESSYKAASTPEDDTPKKVESGPSTDEEQVQKGGKSTREGGTTSEKEEEQKKVVVVDHVVQPPKDIAAIFAEYIGDLDFDKLPWEVEVTAKVVKFFKDTKKSSSDIRGAAAKIIYRLAEGMRNEHLSKIVSTEKSLQLYEARMTKAARVLWEKAISYSAKLTGTSAIPVYSEVIRVWEIVLDHDNLDRRIKYCAEQIEKSHLRGFKATVRWSLFPQKTNPAIENGERVRGRKVTDIPMRFLLPSLSEMASEHHFVPAASTKEDEYNVTTFYSFDTIAFKSMLLGTNDRRDFPFKEWQKEHEIIKLTSKEAILLLGRSGTGKTTCCLYRLWNEFKNYWNPESNTFRWKIPRRRLIPAAVLMTSTDDSEDADDAEFGEPETNSSTEENPDALCNDGKVKVQPLNLEEEVHEACSQDNCATTPISAVTPTSSITPTSANRGAETNVFQIGEGMEVIEEDLHQVFITKNYVLCDQMKKRFYNMAAAFDFLDQHMKYEVTEIASNLLKVEDCAYPLFLTARQFYILLDNSLCDGRAFFHRDEEGHLKVKITSLDYDHEDPDILLDLEQSDSEDEEMEVASSGVTQSPSKGYTERWTEVTALYFKEYIWPNISHQCGISSKDFDPLLVWIEIQSFIKGSETALRKGSYLDLEEYKQIGNRLAPNFSSHRDTIYKVFRKYRKYKQNQRHHNFLFDECDLVLNVYNRLKDVQDVPWSIHSLYIDEVQDFTQAELAIFIHCCRDPNSMFFTGDTAQSIMRGIAFRFQDLRSSFHRIHSKIPLIKVPQKPHNLTINFRSHSGILKLAGSIIDLISEFFKDSIDHLPDDEGMFPGPTPVLLESCKIDDLALLLSTNKREASAIEFGAHQVIIVQSKEAKDGLPSILKGAIVLTVFEAKGLEFDDVLLYNFFTDSMVDEKGWRVVSSYLELTQHRGKIVKHEKLPGSSEDPRSRHFDAKLHKSLNSELKYLYTAVTRAKCNLWIYDSDRKTRLPMFDYWHKRNLVRVVQAQHSGESEGVYNLVFASNSTPEQWKAQGDNFKKKHLWDQAILCYQRAGPENEYLAKEAHAYHLIQRARHQKPQLYLEAALSFLECDRLHHSLHYLNGAALCLRNSKPPKYHEAAQLFERLGDLEKAAQSYMRGRDIDNYAKLKEHVGQHGEVVRALMGKPFMRKRDALAKASDYEKQGIKLHQDLSTSELSYSCAKFYSERRDRETLIEVLEYMPEVSRKVKFLKDARLYEEAFDTLIESKEFKDAYRIASAQGVSKPGLSDPNKSWLQRGLKAAEQNKDEGMKASFIFQMAKVEYKQVKNQPETANSDTVKNLDTLIRSHRDPLIKAQAYLLLGMLKRDVSLCRTAWRTYHSLNHKVGELESFNQIQQLASESDQSLLNVCHLAKETGDTLMRASDIVKVVKEALNFYGLQKIGVYCYTPPGQDIWIGEPLTKCVSKSNRNDLDGMMKLEASDTRDELAKHCRNFKTTWLARVDLKKKLEPKFMSFYLHKQLWEHRHLVREYSMKEVSSEALRDYLQTSVLLLELRSLRDESTDALIVLLVSIFTPRVYIYLPHRIKEEHIAVIRRSVNSRSLFQRFIQSTIQSNGSSEKFPERVKAEPWLMAWRASCISEPDLKYLLNMILKLEKEVNEDSKAPPTQPGAKYEPPPGFIYWRKDKNYFHIFSFWLQSCIKMREERKFLRSSQLAIYHFLGNIAENSHQCSITVMNVVDILSIHCTGLLAIITHANALQNRPTFCTIPLFYKSSTFLFSLMNSFKKEDCWLLSACAEEVRSWRNLGRLYSECRTLLIRALGLLLGGYRAPHYSVLKIGLKKIASTDATKQCLILALVLFGNLSMLRVRETREFHQKIQFLLKRSLSKEENMPDYVSEAYKAVLNPHFPNPDNIFSLVEQLLRDARVDSTLARLVFRAKGQHTKVEIIPMPPTHRPMWRASNPQPAAPIQMRVHPAVSGMAPGHQLEEVGIGSISQNPNVPVPYSSFSMPPGSNTGVPFTAIPTSLPYTGVPRPEPLAQHPTGYASLPLGTSVDVPQTAADQPSMTQNPIGSDQSPQQTGDRVPKEPIKARVVASYTADELKKLYEMSTQSEEQVTDVNTPSAHQPSIVLPGNVVGSTVDQPSPGQDEFVPFTFEVPGEYDEQEQAQLEPEADSREQEDDMSMTLAGEDLGRLLSQINPELLDPEIVTPTFCNACGIRLKADEDDVESSETKEQDLEADDLELYSAHVQCELHSSNVILCKQFTAIMSNESGNELYPNLREVLFDLLYDCQTLKKDYDLDKLDRPIDIIQEELDENERTIAELEESRNWRKLNEEISKMVDTMDRLLKRYRSLYTQVSDDLKRSKRWHFGSEGGLDGDGGGDMELKENREQQEFDQLSERFDPADSPVSSLKGGGASGSKKLRSEADKIKSRVKKKDKRRPGK